MSNEEKELEIIEKLILTKSQIGLYKRVILELSIIEASKLSPEELIIFSNKMFDIDEI